jgi:colanic acid/amylovoran biosynthesis glycosyltransferase
MDLRLGYLVPEFPAQTHVFFWREITALRDLGENLFLLSTRRPAARNCRHAFAMAAISQTHYVFPPLGIGPLALREMTSGRLSHALQYLNELEPVALKNRLRHYILLGSALDLVRWTQQKQINHVHAHSCADAAHVLALARRMGGPPYSLTLHGDLEVYGTDHRSKMRDAAFVSVVGDHLRRQVIERVGLSADRIMVNCMGVDTSQLTTLGRDRCSTAGRLHMVTVARLHPNKGHLHALAAINRGIRSGLDLHYTIAGGGPFVDSIRSRVIDLGLESRVTLTGTLSEIEVANLLSRADAFLLPSEGLGEAWPVSVMEAMAAGLPVVASEIGATPEMITPGEDGFLVQQGDELALLDMITLLATNLHLRSRVGDAARRTAQRRFDVRKTARALRDAVRASLTHPEFRYEAMIQ